MQKNDFEKSVQQRMDELQLYPTAGLWPEVERRIRKEKKRRRFIFWILFPLLLTGTGTAIYLLSANNKKNISSNNTKDEAREPVQQNIGDEIKNDSDIHERPVTTITIKDSAGNIQTLQVSPTVQLDASSMTIGDKKAQSVKNDQPVVSFESKNGGKRKSKENLLSKAQAEPVSPVKNEEIMPADTIITLEEEEPIVVTAIKSRNDVPKAKNDSADLPVSNVKDTKTPGDSAKIVSKPVVETSDSSIKTDSPAPLAKKNANKWKTGVTLITGLSGRAGGIYLGGQKDLAFNNNGPAIGGPTGLASYSQDLGSLNVFWEAGAYIQNNSKKRTSVSFGLSVSSFAHGQQVGAFRDSAITSDGGGYYNSGSSSVYHNRYYYLQLPMMIHWQLSKRKNSMVWQNGFSPSFLLGNKALIYNYSRDIYYRDKSTQNKIQLAFRTGLYKRFASVSKHPLSAGLFFNYNLTGFQKRFQYDRNHHYSFGVQLMMQLKKD